MNLNGITATLYEYLHSLKETAQYGIDRMEILEINEDSKINEIEKAIYELENLVLDNGLSCINGMESKINDLKSYVNNLNK